MNRQSNHSSIDWLELDRLVDGRLGDEAYRELLCQIDADPDGWKQCALAFLEHQALEKELSIFADDPNCQLLPCTNIGGDETRPGIVSEKKVVLSTQGSAISSVIGWMSMALCIAGGLALGFTLNSDFQDQLPAASVPGGLQQHLNSVSFASQNEDAGNGIASIERESSKSGETKTKDCIKKGSCFSQRNRFSILNRNNGLLRIGHDSSDLDSIMENHDR